MLNRNASVNRLEKENEMKITQKKKKDQLMEIRKCVIRVHVKLHRGNYWLQQK